MPNTAGGKDMVKTSGLIFGKRHKNVVAYSHKMWTQSSLYSSGLSKTCINYLGVHLNKAINYFMRKWKLKNCKWTNFSNGNIVGNSSCKINIICS